MRDHRLARARFTHEAQDLASLDAKRNARDCLRTVAADGQANRQVFDFQRAHTRLAIFGSSVSRRPSPRMFTASTVAARKTPGKKTLCGYATNWTRPSAMMLPHVGMSGGKPTPRNERIASSRMAKAQM